MFRTYSNNYGCKACLEDDRYSHLITTDSLFFRFLNYNKCNDCIIYKMYKELEEYRDMEKAYIDDGK